MACLSGGESRRWTVLELVERFKNLGICASRASVTAALAELELELELSGWAPWRLLEGLDPTPKLWILAQQHWQFYKMSHFVEGIDGQAVFAWKRGELHRDSSPRLPLGI